MREALPPGPCTRWLPKIGVIGTLVAVALLSAGCGKDNTGGGGGGGAKDAPMDTTCLETQTRGQCSKCRCIGKEGNCSSPVRCTECRSPYVWHSRNSSYNSSDPGVVPDGDCAIECPAAEQRPSMPKNILDLNGIAWPEACFNGTEEQHFFVIGDWGGVYGDPPKTFQNRATIREPMDSLAQVYVANKMADVAQTSRPKFVVNVGDNFYPGGIGGPGTCDAETGRTDASGSIVFTGVYEKIYKGDGIDGVEWWGVLGNHDYGGYHYNVHWDQNVFYTWHKDNNRWLTPALYWSRKVQFRDFTVDFFFLDSNIADTPPPDADPNHNICSREHNKAPEFSPSQLTCNGTSITDADTCYRWFLDMWRKQKEWLAKKLDASVAEWQVIVTHYPPTFEPMMSEAWTSYFAKYGVDLYISGHTHQQEVSYKGPKFGDTAYIISGGGGGITSEILPMDTGEDDAYGFMDVIISRDELKIVRYSHGGVDRRTIVRGTTIVAPRARAAAESEIELVV